jgi:hypothetical protein
VGVPEIETVAPEIAPALRLVPLEAWLHCIHGSSLQQEGADTGTPGTAGQAGQTQRYRAAEPEGQRGIRAVAADTAAQGR